MRMYRPSSTFFTVRGDGSSWMTLSRNAQVSTSAVTSREVANSRTTDPSSASTGDTTVSQYLLACRAPGKNARNLATCPVAPVRTARSRENRLSSGQRVFQVWSGPPLPSAPTSARPRPFMYSTRPSGVSSQIQSWLASAMLRKSGPSGLVAPFAPAAPVFPNDVPP